MLTSAQAVIGAGLRLRLQWRESAATAWAAVLKLLVLLLVGG